MLHREPKRPAAHCLCPLRTLYAIAVAPKSDRTRPARIRDCWPMCRSGHGLSLCCQSLFFGREGIGTDISTLADWADKTATLLEPLADVIGGHAPTDIAFFVDGTPVRMLAPGRGKPGRHRSGPMLRDERPRNSDMPPADRHAGIEELCYSGDIREVVCIVHIRRKLDDIHRAQTGQMMSSGWETLRTDGGTSGPGFLLFRWKFAGLRLPSLQPRSSRR